MQTSSKNLILASSFVVFGLVGPLTFWLGERSSQASSSCTPEQKQADDPAVVFPEKNH